VLLTGAGPRPSNSMAHYFIDGAYLDKAYENDLVRPYYGSAGELDIPSVIASPGILISKRVEFIRCLLRDLRVPWLDRGGALRFAPPSTRLIRR